MLALAFLVLAVSVGSWFYSWRKNRFSIFKNSNIPGPEPNLLFGNSLEIMQKGDVVAFSDWTKEYGDVVGFFSGACPCILVKDVDLIRSIQMKDAGNISERTMESVFSILHIITKMHLQSGSGDNVKRIRRLIPTMFKSTNLKKIFNWMVMSADALVKDLNPGRHPAGSVEVCKHFGKFAAQVSSGFVLENARNGKGHPAKPTAEQLYTCSLEVVNTLSTRWFTGLTEGLPEFSVVWKMLHSLVLCLGLHPLARLRKIYRRLMTENDFPADPEKSDLVTLMLHAAAEAKAQPGSQPANDAPNQKFRYDTEMESNALIILIAGSVPICKALSSCAFFLAKYQDIQKKARAEVEATLARDGKLTFDNISAMRYLKQVLLESLRYTSSAFGFNTRITGQEHSYKGLTIPKGVTVVVPSFDLHNDPDLFSKPELFDPERFDGKGKSAEDTAALQVFNNGLGTCVGMKLAQVEIVLALARLLAEYRLVLDETRHTGGRQESHMIARNFKNPEIWIKFENIVKPSATSNGTVFD
ncbi:cytochrome P450 3A4-like isoform X2 [Ixodes scapularis]|uniref:cytochrome P450 3A4-like isoform X2 n=1 Tax=Ixodes scapularis TaxID=6945 RepID=UPI001A9FF7BA|nr:cytochrome P450 3A4-like isoform X2 [Ixodes scapularis]